MKLSEIRAILAEVDAAEAQLATDSEVGNMRPETLQRRNRAYIAADKLDLEALVRQWLPIVEAAAVVAELNLVYHPGEYWINEGMIQSFDDLNSALEGIEE